MKSRLSVLIACVFWFAGAAWSSELDTILGSLHSMKADFIQTIYDNKGKAIQKSYGDMALVRPGKFRWKTVKPLPQLIIANKSRLWIYDPDLEQVTIRALHKATGESPAIMLSNENEEIDKDYTVKTMEGKAGNKRFILKPKSQDSVFEQVELVFNGQQLMEMRLNDHLGHSTHIQFTHTKTNVTLPDSLFVFKNAPNIDVIDETRRKH